MTIAKTAVELAVIATGRIDANNERESMRVARQDVRTIASLFEIDAETLWKAAFDEWYRIGREAYRQTEVNRDIDAIGATMFVSGAQ